MSECICNSCKNLRGIPDDKGAIDNYECKYGFPSDACTDCEGEGCDLKCDNYICDDGQDKPIKLNCKLCGKELEQVCGDTDEGDAYCIDCFLKSK